MEISQPNSTGTNVTQQTRWCSICGVDNRPIGILSVSYKVKGSRTTDTQQGSRYMCDLCAKEVYKISIDAKAMAKPAPSPASTVGAKA